VNAITTVCRVVGCDGRWHDDDMCDVVLADLQGEGVSLIAEVDSVEGGPVELVVWEGEDGRDLLRTTSPAAGHAFADRLRALAAAVDKGAALLAPAVVEPVDYAARFAALDSDVLFDLEDGGDCDTAQRYVQSLLMVLAEWRPRVVAMLADAPEWAVPEAAVYRRALDRTREAWAQYSFRYEGGPVLPWPFDLPEPVAPVALADAQPVARIVSVGRRALTVRGVAA
jgi:hypothetical protein